MKIFFDPHNLTDAHENIDFDRSHLHIDVTSGDVEWVQCLKTSPDEERFVVVKSGVIVM